MIPTTTDTEQTIDWIEAFIDSKKLDSFRHNFDQEKYAKLGHQEKVRDPSDLKQCIELPGADSFFGTDGKLYLALQELLDFVGLDIHGQTSSHDLATRLSEVGFARARIQGKGELRQREEDIGQVCCESRSRRSTCSPPHNNDFLAKPTTRLQSENGELFGQETAVLCSRVLSTYT